MRLSHLRLRFTVRRLMVAVAIVGVIVFLGIHVDLERRRWSYLGLAAGYRDDAIRIRLEAEQISEERSHHSRMSDEVREEVRATRERSERNMALAAKYLHAARHPWLPVSPDPPEPK